MENRGYIRGNASYIGFWGVPRPPFVADTRTIASFPSESPKDILRAIYLEHGIMNREISLES